MQRATWPRYSHHLRQGIWCVRYASTRSFERPLARPPKRSAAQVPARVSGQELIKNNDSARIYAEQLQRAKDELDRRLKSQQFFSTKKPSLLDYKKYIPPWLRGMFRPWMLVLYAITGYVGYRLYNWRSDFTRTQILSPRFFFPFVVESREPVSSTSAVISGQNYPEGQDGSMIDAAWKTGVWSVQVSQPDLQIARSYTPLPPSSPDMPPERIRLYVREEPKGEVSGMLHRMPIGSFMHLRGPYPEFEIPDGVKEIVFLAGGTGIAPALQVAHCLYKARGLASEDMPKMKILWANRRREDSRQLPDDEAQQLFRAGIWNRIRGAITTREGVQKIDIALDDQDVQNVKVTRLVDELEGFATDFKDKISIDHFVDEERSFITEKVLRSHLLPEDNPKNGWFKSEEPQSGDDADTSGKRIIMVSGPEGFVNYYTGPKVSSGLKEERSGALGGVLGRVNPPGWKIWTF